MTTIVNRGVAKEEALGSAPARAAVAVAVPALATDGDASAHAVADARAFPASALIKVKGNGNGHANGNGNAYVNVNGNGHGHANGNDHDHDHDNGDAAIAVASASTMLSDDRRSLPFDACSGSRPPGDAFSSAFRRACRTAAPFIISDLAALALCGLIAQALTSLVFPEAGPVVGRVGGAALFALLVGYWLGGIYSEIWIHPAIELRQLTHVSTLALLPAMAGGAAAYMPVAAWAVAAWACTVTIVPLLRTIARAGCVNRPWWGYPALIIGSGEAADEVARLVLDCPRSGLRPVLLNDPQGACRRASVRVVNDPATLESLVRTEGLRHAVVSLPHYSNARLTALLDRYSNLLPHILVVADTATLPTLWAGSRSGGRLSGIEVRNSVLMATLQCVKRLIDVTVALAALAVGLPLIVLIALAIKLVNPGPVLFGHTRIGRHGRPFKAWKFRTMHVNGDAILLDYLQRVASARVQWQRDQKLLDDPRVTRLGKFLRRTSLDELPQLWNVLRGDMSIVGPRPIVESEVPRYAKVFRLYTTMKPGITGLWQVSGRSTVSYEDRVRLDQFYIRHWSPWLDIYILAKTVVALLKREGAC
ncbi:MAG TPA: undecaprenyl-phosphate galactose phosphotransferase WbaP [Tepidisphaeraceae bacterium]|nr:undecaprenyl-phosphate galactose phosphotransferase WbaP [Tepidisphaeraceae bacterium]